MATVETLMTAEEFLVLADNGRPAELVRGRVVPMNMPAPRHGEICANIVDILKTYLRQHDTGRVVCNDSGIVTERGPDTVRGADVAYYSYAKYPKGPLPRGYLKLPPELIFEVRSPGDRWPEVVAKTAEYLKAGVLHVCVIDEQTETATVHSAEGPPETLSAGRELRFPSVLPGFAVPVRPFLA